MFVVVIDYPPVKPGKDEEFREWFVWTNKEFRQFKGFISRRLLKPEGEGNYAAVVEFESREALAAIQANPIHDEAAKRVTPLLDGNPALRFYDLLIG